MSTDPGFERLGRFFDRLGPAIQQGLDEDVVRLGAAGLARLKLAASGRPGPRRVTGDYTRQMNMQADHGANGVEVTIGGAGVQGPRLEHGFFGEDSLGRHFSQRAYPHYAPTAAWLNSLVGSQIANTIGRAVGQAGAG